MADKRVLTDDDIHAVVEAWKEANQDSILTTDEVVTLKKILRAFDNAAGIVGKVILTSCVVALVAIFTKGFWLYMASGVKQGVGK